jgi:hypothetical protein
MPEAYCNCGKAVASCRRYSATAEGQWHHAGGILQLQKGSGILPEAFCNCGKVVASCRRYSAIAERQWHLAGVILQLQKGSKIAFTALGCLPLFVS